MIIQTYFLVLEVLIAAPAGKLKKRRRRRRYRRKPPTAAEIFMSFLAELDNSESFETNFFSFEKNSVSFCIWHNFQKKLPFFVVLDIPQSFKSNLFLFRRKIAKIFFFFFFLKYKKKKKKILT